MIEITHIIGWTLLWLLGSLITPSLAMIIYIMRGGKDKEIGIIIAIVSIVIYLIITASTLIII